jgi:hypothetical protein
VYHDWRPGLSTTFIIPQALRGGDDGIEAGGRKLKTKTRIPEVHGGVW